MSWLQASGLVDRGALLQVDGITSIISHNPGEWQRTISKAQTWQG